MIDPNCQQQDSVNGVVWYILGVNFVLSLYPQDIATVAILMYVSIRSLLLMSCSNHPFPDFSLSWADTAASTFGRLYGSTTRKLPARLPFLRLPLAPRKSLAGFTAATFTGAAIALGFWGFVAPMRNDGQDISWGWQGGVRQVTTAGGDSTSMGAGGALGLLAITVVAGFVSGIAEALGTSLSSILMLTILIFLSL